MNKTTLKRYTNRMDNFGNWGMVESLDGEWMRYEDVVAIVDVYSILLNENIGTSLTEEEYDNQMRGEIQRHGGG